MDPTEDGSFSGSDLIESLAANATSAYQTTVIANANPLNAALITGGSASTPSGSAAGGVSAIGGGTGIFLLIAAVFAVIIATR